MRQAAANRPAGLAPLEPGDRVAERYVVKRVLGQGGMGQVVEAELIALGKPCAIKVLRLERWNDELVRRFNREARALARVTSPRVAQVTDFGVDESAGPFYVMELLEGETLEDRIERDGAMPPRKALTVALEIAEALGDVHRSGLVHRDLKPSNVGLTASGPVEIKLLDFGLAASIDDAFLSRITQSQQILGSLPYMAPEQFNGAPPAPSMDLYALGIVLYEMTSGRMPFMAPSTAALIHQILSAPVPPVADSCANVPGFAPLVERLLAKSPEDRFPNAAAAARALRDLLAPMGGPSPRPAIAPETRDFDDDTGAPDTGKLPPTGAAAAILGGAAAVMPTMRAPSVSPPAGHAESSAAQHAPPELAESGLRVSRAPSAALMPTAPSQPAYPLPSASQLSASAGLQPTVPAAAMPASALPSPVASAPVSSGPTTNRSAPLGVQASAVHVHPHVAVPVALERAPAPLGFRLAVIGLLGLIFAGLSAIAVIGGLSLISPAEPTTPAESAIPSPPRAAPVPELVPVPVVVGAPAPDRPAADTTSHTETDTETDTEPPPEPAPRARTAPRPRPRPRTSPPSPPPPATQTPRPLPPTPRAAPTAPPTYDPQAIREW